MKRNAQRSKVELARDRVAELDGQVRQFARDRARTFTAGESIAYRMKLGELQKARDSLRRAELAAKRKLARTIGPAQRELI